MIALHMIGRETARSAVNVLPQSNTLAGTNWFGVNGATATPNASTGRAGALVTQVTAGASTFGGWVQQVTLLDGLYTVSAWVRSVSGSASFQFGIGASFSATFTATTDWQRFTFTATPGAGAINVQIATAGAAAFDLYVEDMQVQPGPTRGRYVPTGNAARHVYA